MNKPIFIAGTGRSGSTLLLRLFAAHQEVFAITWETRFIVDTGGLMDLIDALSSSYSPSRARESLYRFEQMMRVDLIDPRTRPYYGYALAKRFGDSYWNALDKFCEALVAYEFTGLDHPITEPDNALVQLIRRLERLGQRLFRRRIYPSPRYPRPRIREPHYFSNRQDLTNLAQAYVNELFSVPAMAEGKTVWCEKTPHNLFHLDFLHEIFPEARFINTIRDPRDVACSYLEQVWTPNRLEDVVTLLQGIYQAWFDRQHASKIPARQYHEVRLEDLISTTGTTLASIQNFCNLDQPFKPGDMIKAGMVANWRKKLTTDQIAYVERELGDAISRLGYLN